MASLLFVEDEAGLRGLIGEALSDHGFAVTVALDGRSAMQLLAVGEFDVVVSDVTMPGGLSGIELAEYIHEKHGGTRVILVSGHARAQLPPLPAASEFLPKPYRLSQLIGLLESQRPSKPA